MLRRIALSLLLVISTAVMLPIASSTAHGIRQTIGVKSQRRVIRRHSRAWWRRYRARLRRKRASAAALAAHRRAMMLPTITPNSSLTAKITPTQNLPAGWNPQTSSSVAELKFRTSNGNPATAGEASLAVVAMSRPTPTYLSAREQRKMLSGINVADLRRIVIDRMVTAGGWVTNDFVREITGHRVFVVTAQTPADGRLPEKSWNFYFTEVNGRIYSLTTNTPPEFANRMAIEAELFISSLYRNQSTSTSTSTNR